MKNWYIYIQQQEVATAATAAAAAKTQEKKHTAAEMYKSLVGAIQPSRTDN